MHQFASNTSERLNVNASLATESTLLVNFQCLLLFQSLLWIYLCDISTIVLGLFYETIAVLKLENLQAGQIHEFGETDWNRTLNSYLERFLHISKYTKKFQ